MRMATISVCAMGIVLLAGCDQISSYLNDNPGYQQPRRPRSTSARNATASRRSAPPAAVQQERTDGSLQLLGLDETEVRAMFGAPAAAEDTGPGKIWRYRNGQCTLNLSFYPDVQTRVYRTLAYEVSSDDNSAERRRYCFSQFQSVARFR